MSNLAHNGRDAAAEERASALMHFAESGYLFRFPASAFLSPSWVSKTMIFSLQEPGVVAFITAEDVPGENKVKGGPTDGLLLAEGIVEYVGQPIALVVATTQRGAEDAARRVAVVYGHSKVCACTHPLSAPVLFDAPWECLSPLVCLCEAEGSLWTPVCTRPQALWHFWQFSTTSGLWHVQELGVPLLSIPDAIAAGSFYPTPDAPGFVAGTDPGRVRVGDPDAAMAIAANRITGARSDQ